MTHKPILCIALLYCTAPPLLAQEAPQVEVFAGYSYLRAKDSLSVGVNQNGWELSAAFNFARSFSVVADFSNHYGFRPRNFAPIGSGGKGFAFLFGPQYSYRRMPRLTPFAHALFGAIQANRAVPAASFGGVTGGGFGSFSILGCVSALVCYEPVTDFAMALGGGLDVKATNRLWLRAFQVDYFRANLKAPSGTPVPQNDLRISTGLVFRFRKGE